MSIRQGGIRIDVLRRCVAHLLLLVFAARALVPVGYMPDFSATAKGVFDLVICSGIGAKTVALDADGKQVPQKGVHHNQPCAFTGMAGVALLTALDPVPPAAPKFDIKRLAPEFAFQVPPARAGPQLGTRGPPQFS